MVENERFEAKDNIYGSFLNDLQQKDTPLLPDSEVRLLLNTVQNEFEDLEIRKTARNEVADSMLRTIPFVLKEIPSIGSSPEELVGEAFETINSCIDNFNLEFVSSKTDEPVQFYSYVIQSLRKRLLSPRTVMRIDQTIEIPQAGQNMARRMRQSRGLFIQEESTEPTRRQWYLRTIKLIRETEKIKTSNEVNIDFFNSINTATFAQKIPLGSSKIHGNINSDNLSVTTELIDNKLIDPSENVEEKVTKKMLAEEVEAILQSSFSITNVQKEILRLRFGVGLDTRGMAIEPKSRAEVGELFGVSKEKIRQVETIALKKIKRIMVMQGTHKYLYDD